MKLKIILFLIFACSIIGCTSEATRITMSGDILNGSRIISCQINSTENTLDFVGPINFSSGKAGIQVVSADSGEIFFSSEYTANSDIVIHVMDLHNKKNVNIVVDGENLKDYLVFLQSEQEMSVKTQKT